MFYLQTHPDRLLIPKGQKYKFQYCVMYGRRSVTATEYFTPPYRHLTFIQRRMYVAINVMLYKRHVPTLQQRQHKSWATAFLTRLYVYPAKYYMCTQRSLKPACAVQLWIIGYSQSAPERL